MWRRLIGTYHLHIFRDKNLPDKLIRPHGYPRSHYITKMAVMSSCELLGGNLKAITCYITFTNGEQMVFIGPEQYLPDCEIENVGFSEPEEMPDCRLSEIDRIEYVKMSDTRH